MRKRLDDGRCKAVPGPFYSQQSPTVSTLKIRRRRAISSNALKMVSSKVNTIEKKMRDMSDAHHMKNINIAMKIMTDLD